MVNLPLSIVKIRLWLPGRFVSPGSAAVSKKCCPLRGPRFRILLPQRGVYCEPHFRGAFHRRTEGRNPSRSKLLRQRTRRWHLQPSETAPAAGWVLRDREIYPDACGDGSSTTEWREPASCDRLPVHRSESPTGYPSAGCSPAEPASASPVTDNVAQSRSGVWLWCRVALVVSAASRGVISTLHTG